MYHSFDSTLFIPTLLLSGAIIIHGYLISRKPPPKII